MKRISDDEFIVKEYDADNVVGIRVIEGKIFFLAWMENAPHYKIQQAISSEGYQLDRDLLILTDGDIFERITELEGYNHMYILYETDDDGCVINEEDKAFKNAHDKFLSLLENRENSDCDHNIFTLTKVELSYICDSLRDGDYVLVLED